MFWWTLCMAAIAPVIVLALADIRDLQALQYIRSNRREHSRIVRERMLEWATLVFFALISSLALLLVARQVSGILGE